MFVYGAKISAIKLFKSSLLYIIYYKWDRLEVWCAVYKKTGLRFDTICSPGEIQPYSKTFRGRSFPLVLRLTQLYEHAPHSFH